MRGLLRAFFLDHPSVVAYMLQSTEYEVGPYLRWYWRTQDFSKVMRRRTLDMTRRARLLLTAVRIGMALQAALGLALLIAGIRNPAYAGIAFFGAALLVSYPVVWAHLIVVPLLAVKYLIVGPKDRKLIAASEARFAGHPGARIAVVGSYGKTTMKELLATVLSEGLKVEATPGNKNVAISHAVFARQLTGDEDVLIIEYGEGAPGDVVRFARTTHPTHGVITGLAPAHLDKYGTLQKAGADIFSVADVVPHDKLFVNADSPAVKPFLKPEFIKYTEQGVAGYTAHDIHVGVNGTSFTLRHGKQVLKLQSGLLGRHQVGPLTAVAAIGLSLGMSPQQVEAGVARTVSFEHRMRPYQLGGAWIIDDTYNGNLEGIRAGTELLREVSARRKWYVTPGLVEQGSDTAAIHTQAGEYIAAAQPDVVVLMQNSVTRYIQHGLDTAGYQGEVRLESDPLAFYTNLDQFVTAGDVVLMQNDWTDNYA